MPQQPLSTLGNTSMKQYDVKITDQALTDMEMIYDYIVDTLNAPIAAMRQYNRIAERIKSLGNFPYRCHLFDSEPERSMGLCQLLIDNYSIIYMVTNNIVTVLRVLYSASDIRVRLLGDTN